VGKPHGLDGSFWVDDPGHDLAEGTLVHVAGAEYRINRRGGTDDRPLVRLAAVDDARPLRGQTLLVEDTLAEDEWLASDLVGLEVEGRGTVRRVLDGPSCSVLELEDGSLIPFVSDAIRSVGRDRIEVREEFLG